MTFITFLTKVLIVKEYFLTVYSQNSRNFADEKKMKIHIYAKRYGMYQASLYRDLRLPNECS